MIHPKCCLVLHTTILFKTFYYRLRTFVSWFFTSNLILTSTSAYLKESKGSETEQKVIIGRLTGFSEYHFPCNPPSDVHMYMCIHIHTYKYMKSKPRSPYLLVCFHILSVLTIFFDLPGPVHSKNGIMLNNMCQPSQHMYMYSCLCHLAGPNLLYFLSYCIFSSDEMGTKQKV